MNLTAVSCSVHQTPVAVRERLAFAPAQVDAALADWPARFGGELVILSTCNRVELYTSSERAGLKEVADYLGEVRLIAPADILPHLKERRGPEAVRHLFRVAASLESLIVGEGQIAGQVRGAFELAVRQGATGALFNVLFPNALRSAKRVRTETNIARGHVSVSSVAVDYVRQVFDRFDDKAVLVIGAGKMAGLTLKHLRDLAPARIQVTNRTPEKAREVAAGCGGVAVPWEQLDDALATADIVLSTTGAPEPVVSRARFQKVLARRGGRPVVIIDIAVPRDFDPAIHDGDRVCLFNVDDLKRTVEATLGERRRHLPAAEAIVDAEVRAFTHDWQHRKHAPLIGQLTGEFDAKREVVVAKLLARLNGKLTPEERAYVAGAFRLFQNQVLHSPIAAMREAAKNEGGHHLLDALKKLFRLSD